MAAALCHGASGEDSDQSPAPSASVINPAVAGPGLGGSPAAGVCVCCAAVQGGGVDVREETLRSEELLCVFEAGGCQQALVGPG